MNGRTQVKIRSAALALTLALSGGAPASLHATEDAPAAPAKPPAAEAKRPVREFNLFVKEWTWEPATLRVKKGSHVVLHVESIDGARSLVIKELGVKAPLPEGERVIVEFDADRAGTFTFACGRPCGNGCAKLRGSLVVLE
jgi:heme/copper-type cytochrome/quinol oxidase subunit 2